MPAERRCGGLVECVTIGSGKRLREPAARPARPHTDPPVEAHPPPLRNVRANAGPVLVRHVAGNTLWVNRRGPVSGRDKSVRALGGAAPSRVDNEPSWNGRPQLRTTTQRPRDQTAT
jgi:hypothetical protein